MTSLSSAKSNDRTERWISSVLKVGSYSSAALLLAGVLLALFSGVQAVHYPLAALPAQLARLDPTAVMQAGIALLLLTPLVRLAVAMACFSRDGEARYAWISAGVLLIIVSSVLVRLVG